MILGWSQASSVKGSVMVMTALLSRLRWDPVVHGNGQSWFELEGFLELVVGVRLGDQHYLDRDSPYWESSGSMGSPNEIVAS